MKVLFFILEVIMWVIKLVIFIPICVLAIPLVFLFAVPMCLIYMIYIFFALIVFLLDPNTYKANNEDDKLQDKDEMGSTEGDTKQ